MAITYPLSLPVGHRNASQIVIRGNTVTAQSESPYNYIEQVQVFPGQRWTATITLPPMKRVDADAWTAFLLSLNGKEGTFLMGDPASTTPKGVATGTPLSNGVAAASQNQLPIDGCTINTTGWMKAGDYIHLVLGGKYRLHMLLQDVDTNGSGQTTLTLWPKLREAVPDNTPIVVTNTLGQWRLGQSFTERTIDVGSNYSQSFTCVEAL